MKKTEQIGNIKIIIDDSYCHNENIDDILKECGKLVNTVNLRKKEEKYRAFGFCSLTLNIGYSIINR